MKCIIPDALFLRKEFMNHVDLYCPNGVFLSGSSVYMTHVRRMLSYSIMKECDQYILDMSSGKDFSARYGMNFRIIFLRA